MYARSAALAGCVAAGLGAVRASRHRRADHLHFPGDRHADPVLEPVRAASRRSSSAPNDPGGFFVAPTTFRTLSGDVLANSELGGNAFVPLDITFSAPVNSVSFGFALDVKGPGTLDLKAFNGGSQVGSTSAPAPCRRTTCSRRGVMNFSGATFDSLVLSDRLTRDLRSAR